MFLMAVKRSNKHTSFICEVNGTRFQKGVFTQRYWIKKSTKKCCKLASYLTHSIRFFVNIGTKYTLLCYRKNGTESVDWLIMIKTERFSKHKQRRQINMLVGKKFLDLNDKLLTLKLRKDARADLDIKISVWWRYLLPL